MNYTYSFFHEGLNRSIEPNRGRIWPASLERTILWQRHVTDYTCIQGVMDIRPTHFVKWAHELNLDIDDAQLCWTICVLNRTHAFKVDFVSLMSCFADCNKYGSGIQVSRQRLKWYSPSCPSGIFLRRHGSDPPEGVLMTPTMPARSTLQPPRA